MPDGGRVTAWIPRALRVEDAAHYVGLSTTTFRQVVAPSVPAVRLTDKRVAWLREDLDAWLDRLKPRVDGPAAPGDPPRPEAPHGTDIIAAGLAALSPKRRPRRPQAPR